MFGSGFAEPMELDVCGQRARQAFLGCVEDGELRVHMEKSGCEYRIYVGGSLTQA